MASSTADCMGCPWEVDHVEILQGLSVVVSVTIVEAFGIAEACIRLLSRASRLSALANTGRASCNRPHDAAAKCTESWQYSSLGCGQDLLEVVRRILKTVALEHEVGKDHGNLIQG